MSVRNGYPLPPQPRRNLPPHRGHSGASSANCRDTRIALRSLEAEGTMLRLKQRQREIHRSRISYRWGNTVAPMANALMFFGAIAVLMAIVVFLDWLGRRKDRNATPPSP
jgi:hypothetical protein